MAYQVPVPIMGGISGRPGDNIGLGESIPVRMNGDLTYPYYTCMNIYIYIISIGYGLLDYMI